MEVDGIATNMKALGEGMTSLAISIATNMKALEEAMTSLAINIEKEDESLTARTDRRKENLPGPKKTGKLYPGLGIGQVLKDIEDVRTDGWNENLSGFKKTEKLIQKAVYRQRLDQGSSGCKRKRSQEETIERKRKSTRRQKLQQGSSGPGNYQVPKDLDGISGRVEENPDVKRNDGRNENLPGFKKIGKLIKEAIHRQRHEQGSSLNSIKCYLASKCDLDVKAADSLIRNNLRVAVYRGIISEIDGKYTIKERRRTGAERECPGLGNDQVPKDLEGVRTGRRKGNLPGLKKNGKFIQKAIHRQRNGRESSGSRSDQVPKDLEGISGRVKENPARKRTDGRNENLPGFKKIGKLIKEAIRRERHELGSSLNSIKCYLASKCHLDVKAADSLIRSSLRVALYRGILSEIGGKYAIKERRRRGTEREYQCLGSDQVPKDLEDVRTDGWNENLPDFKETEKLVQKAVCRQRLEEVSSGCKRKRSQEEAIDRKRKATRRQRLLQGSSAAGNDLVPKDLEGVRGQVAKNLGLNIDKESENISFKEIGKLILKAFRSQGHEQGSSLNSIKCYLASKCRLEIKAADSRMRKSRRVALYRGILLEIDGKYAIKERRRRGAERECPCLGSDQIPKDLEDVRTDGWNENLPGFKKTEKLIQKAVCRQRLEQGSSGRKRKRSEEELKPMLDEH